MSRQMAGVVGLPSLVTISAATAAQLLPVVAVWQLSPPRPPARLWIGVWAAVFFASDVAQILVSNFAGQNLRLFTYVNPIEDAALLMAYSYWQVRPVIRLSFRIGIPLLAIATLGITLAVGQHTTFKSASSPFRLLILTTAVAYTLVSLASREGARIWDRDWMWTSLGVILYTAAFVVVDPVSAMLTVSHPELLLMVYVVKAVVDTVALLMVGKGMRCPLETTSSPSTLAPS